MILRHVTCGWRSNRNLLRLKGVALTLSNWRGSALEKKLKKLKKVALTRAYEAELFWSLLTLSTVWLNFVAQHLFLSFRVNKVVSYFLEGLLTLWLIVRTAFLPHDTALTPGFLESVDVASS
jgi:hypothetical protein